MFPFLKNERGYGYNLTQNPIKRNIFIKPERMVFWARSWSQAVSGRRCRRIIVYAVAKEGSPIGQEAVLITFH